MSKPDQVAPPASPSPMRGLGCLTRMAWMLFGVVILFLSAISIAGHRGSLSTADVVFWVTVVGCIVMRYVDVSRLSGRTVTGQPAIRIVPSAEISTTIGPARRTACSA